jgi:hypothetical protein
MCLEDVRLMRETSANDFVVLVAGVGLLVVPQERKRVALVVQNIGTNPMQISLTKPSALGSGMSLPVGGNPVVFDIQKHGDLVTRGFWAIAAGGAASTIYVSEAVLLKE